MECLHQPEAVAVAFSSREAAGSNLLAGSLQYSTQPKKELAECSAVWVGDAVTGVAAAIGAGVAAAVEP